MKKKILFTISLLTFMILFSFTGTAMASVSVSDMKLPEVIISGDDYSVSGTVKSTNSISYIRCGVYTAEGTWVKGHNAAKYPEKKTYSLSAVSSSAHFDTLPAGTYYYRVYVKDSAGNAKTAVKQQFEVKKAFTASNVKYEKLVIAGRDSTFSGKITSVYKLKTVNAGITDESGKWIKYKSYSPSSKTFNISSVNSSTDLSVLEPGKYYFKIYCYDVSGHKGTVVRKAFEVKDAFSAADLSYEALFVKGEDPAVAGKISSVYPMTRVKAGIYSTENKKWLSYKIYNPGTESFSLSKVSTDIDFSVLDYGMYSFRVYCTDSQGNSAYAVSEEFEVSKPFTVSGCEYPGTLSAGNDKTLKGTIKSVHEIKTVKIGMTQDGKWVSSWTFSPASTEFDIASANSRVTFAKLAAGTYTYRIDVTDVKGNTSSVLKKQFKVVKPTFSVSDNYTYPSLLTEGSSFYILGNVYSDVELKSVRVGICDSSGNWLDGFNVTKKLSGTKTFYISTVDSSISFGKLEPGTYYYRVYATDVNGAYKSVIKKKFTVIKQFKPDVTTKTSQLSEKMYSELNADDVFLSQTLGRGGCTITSVGMMLRREMILSGVDSSAWKLIDEWKLRADSNLWVYGAGLKNGFTTLGMTVKYARFDSNATVSQKKAKFISMLEDHPEGIAIYGNYGGGYHATLLTDYIDGVFYVVDPVYGSKVAIADSTMYSPSAAQTSKLKYTYSYWYIAK